MTTDPIADLLTRIRNASRADLTMCSAPYSKVKENILKILLDKKFIVKFEKTTDQFPELIITLDETRPINLKRISKPGQRIYEGKENMKTIRSGTAIQIVSTSKGLMTTDEARRAKIGGEIICEVY